MSRFVVVSLVMAVSAMTDCQAARRRRSDDYQLSAVVNQLSQQVTTLNAELNALRSEVTALKTKTATMDQTVAFHSWGTHNPVNATGHGLIVLNHVATNIGNAYSPLTGTFTAPVAGLYDFHVSIMTHLTDNLSQAALYVGNSVQAVALSDSRHNYYAQASISVVVHVNVGENVYLKNTDAAASSYYTSAGEPYSTFSGFLIKAD